MSVDTTQVDNARVKEGLRHLRAFRAFLIESQPADQIALTIAAIVTLLAGQTMDVARAVTDAALEAHEQWLRIQEARARDEKSS